MGDLLREGDDNMEDADDVYGGHGGDVVHEGRSRLIFSVIGKQGEGEDKEYPDVPKNWGFMTLRRTKKK